jgi:hypothetical protein
VDIYFFLASFFDLLFFIVTHSLLGLICVPSWVPVPREQTLSRSHLWLEQKEKFTLRTAKAEGTLLSGLAEKTWCLLAVIPVLVFDCIALQHIEGISSLFSRRASSIVWVLPAVSE